MENLMQSQYYPQPLVETSSEMEQSLLSNQILDLDVTITPDEQCHIEYLMREDILTKDAEYFSQILASKTSSDTDIGSVLKLLLKESMSIEILRQSGIGKLVRSLADTEGKVAVYAKKLLAKWKALVIEHVTMDEVEDWSAQSLVELTPPPPTPDGSQEKGNVSMRIQSLINKIRGNDTLLDPIQLHLQLNNLPLTKSRSTLADGNCFYDSLADQASVLNLDLPRNHIDMRNLITTCMVNLPQAHDWILILFNGSEDAFLGFVHNHSKDGTWTQDYR